MANYQKVAVFRALQLGDMLCAVPALRALKKYLPESQITLIGLPWAKEFVLRFNNYLDDFMEFPGYPGLPEQGFNIQKLVQFLGEVQKKKFDLILQMQGNGSIVNSLILLFGASATAGFYQKGGFCPDPKTFLPYPDDIPETRRNLKLMEFLGFPALGEEKEFPFTGKDKQVFGILKTGLNLKEKEYICIHPGGRDKNKRWDYKKFARVADYFSGQGIKIILTGSREEQTLTALVSKAMKSKAIDLAGKTDLGLVANLIKSSRLLISNDTGVSHIADALNTPSVIIFNGSDPKRWAPANQQLHRRVFKNETANIENVISEANQLLDKP